MAGLACALLGQTYTITTIAGSPTASLGDGGNAGGAILITPVGVAIDQAGNIYVSDYGAGQTGRIRKIDKTNTITTLTTAATDAKGIFVDVSGKFLYAAGDGGNTAGSHQVFKVDTTTGATTRIAGSAGAQADSVGDGHLAIQA